MADPIPTLSRRHPLDAHAAEFIGRGGPEVAIAPEPFVAMIDVRLPGGGTVLAASLPVTPNTWVETSSGRAIWLGPDEWLLTADGVTPEDLEAAVADHVRPLGGVAVDVSAQRIGLRLTGSRVRDVLAKGGSLDLHPRVFGAGRAAQTTVGLAGVVLLALSGTGDDFLLLVRSSFAGYLAEWLLDAALEYTASSPASALA